MRNYISKASLLYSYTYLAIVMAILIIYTYNITIHITLYNNNKHLYAVVSSLQ